MHSFLISHGADVETEDMDGRTPLHAAAIWGHDEVIRMLAKRNAYLESALPQRPYNNCNSPPPRCASTQTVCEQRCVARQIESTRMPSPAQPPHMSESQRLW
jgi:ankyrin repeat protein